MNSRKLSVLIENDLLYVTRAPVWRRGLEGAKHNGISRFRAEVVRVEDSDQMELGFHLFF